MSIANAGDLAAGTTFILRFEAVWDFSIVLPNPDWRITHITVSGVEDGGSAIPEPFTVTLVLAGVSLLGLVRRHQRRPAVRC